MFDLRMLTGPAMLVMGAFLLFLAMRLWMVHPVNRVFRLGPYVTEEGIVALLGIRFMIFSYGAFLAVSGAASIIFWYARRAVNDPLVQFTGSLATGLGLVAAVKTIIVFRRLYLRK